MVIGSLRGEPEAWAALRLSNQPGRLLMLVTPRGVVKQSDWASANQLPASGFQLPARSGRSWLCAAETWSASWKLGAGSWKLEADPRQLLLILYSVIFRATVFRCRPRRSAASPTLPFERCR